MVTPQPPHLLLGQLQELLAGLLHLAGRPADGDAVGARSLGGEVDVHAAALLHHRAHQAALGANQRVVQLGWNGDLRLLDVGLSQMEPDREHTAGYTVRMY